MAATSSGHPRREMDQVLQSPRNGRGCAAQGVCHATAVNSGQGTGTARALPSNRTGVDPAPAR